MRAYAGRQALLMGARLPPHSGFHSTAPGSPLGPTLRAGNRPAWAPRATERATFPAGSRPSEGREPAGGSDPAGSRRAGGQRAATLPRPLSSPAYFSPTTTLRATP